MHSVEVTRRRAAEVEQFQSAHQNEIYTTRRENLQALAEMHGGRALSDKLCYRTQSFLSQMVGKGWNRIVSEKTARNYEVQLGLPVGHLDKPLFSEAASKVPSQDAMIEALIRPHQAPITTEGLGVVTDILQTVANIVAEQKANLSIPQFAKLASVAASDAAEHGGKVREAHIKQILELMV